MKKINHILLMLSLLSSMLIANEDGSGAYVGIGLGSTAYVDSGFAKEQSNRNVKEEIAISSLGAKLYGGYQFNKIIGVEAAYIHYGNFSINDDYTYSAQGISLSANVGYTFLTGQLRPYVLLGLGYIFSDFPHENIPVDDKSPTLHIGLGLDYEPMSLGGVGFRVAYESNSFSYIVDEDTAEEEKYPQGFGVLYLGAYYKF